MKQSILLLILLSFLGLSACDFLDEVLGANNDKDSSNEVPQLSVDGLQEEGTWTFMIYMAADNNLELYLLSDVEEMVSGYTKDIGYSIVILVDRADSDVYGSTSQSGLFEENFTDTRMYEIHENGVKRITGGDDFPEITLTSQYEANTGDPVNLKKFIRSTKKQYPADKYALVLWNHGAGPRSVSSYSIEYDGRDVCFDSGSDDDSLFIGEISDVLGADESVDFIGFDACLMGSVEIAYQYRKRSDAFSADIMTASPSEEWGPGWNYKYIFSRLKKETGFGNERDAIVNKHSKEAHYSPLEMNAAEFASICVEEYHDAIEEDFAYEQTMSAYNLAAVSDVKITFDQCAVELLDQKTLIAQYRYFMLTYFDDMQDYDKISTPFYDLYDLLQTIAAYGNEQLALKANTAKEKVDSFILFSYADSFSYSYSDFKNGKNGVSVFMPFGDEVILLQGEEVTHWETQYWYNGETIVSEVSYGNLFWCSDNSQRNNGTVENWFELLDYWYDNTQKGDTNSYEF